MRKLPPPLYRISRKTLTIRCIAPGNAMTPPFVQPAAGTAGRADSASDAERTTGPFVINLCSSNTPMALSQPQAAELKRFTFFVSRRLEDRRERFRLHMGYFDSLQEAEEWLSTVRGVYPGAWAGEAPGKRLRERAAAAPAAVSGAPQPTPAAPPNLVRVTQPTPRPALAATKSAPSPSPSPSPPPRVPTLQAASSAKAPAAPPRPAPKDAAAPPARAKPPIAAPPRMPTPPAAAAKSAPHASAAPARSRTAPRTPVKAAAPAQRSNVREVLAALDETGSTRQMPAVQPPAPSPNPNVTPNASLTDTQVLKILENRRVEGQRAPEAEVGISLLRPDDTGTRQALKAAVVANAPVSFAVQLHWSVQPIDLSRVPPLAIFSAYTLYTVEGSREGRRWYGLRLGFFRDAISAKQVAYYVRSEFASVAVIPVSIQERDRASTAEERSVIARKQSSAAVQDKLPDHATEEFKLFDETIPAAQPTAPAPVKQAAPAASPAAPANRAGKSGAGRVRARERRPAPSLEETLEILGADQLEIDPGTGELLNDSGVRHLKVSVQKNSPFARLLDRLAERVNKT
jgi:hypothetical protein